MALSSKSAEQKKVPGNTATGLDPLVVDLNCDSGIRCRNARVALVEKGPPEAIHAFIDALRNGKEMVPLEAAKALGAIGGSRAIQALIEALEYEKFEVRWEAAEALVKIGPDAVKPLLNAFVRKADSAWLRDGIHHVFSGLEDPPTVRLVQPVLEALDDSLPAVEVPVVAWKVLDELGEK